MTLILPSLAIYNVSEYNTFWIQATYDISQVYNFYSSINVLLSFCVLFYGLNKRETIKGKIKTLTLFYIIGLSLSVIFDIL